MNKNIGINNYIVGGIISINYYCNLPVDDSLYCLEFLISDQSILKIVLELGNYFVKKNSIVKYSIFSGSTQEIFLPQKIIIFVDDIPKIILYDYFGFPLNYVKIDKLENKELNDKINIISHTYLLSMLFAYIVIIKTKGPKYFGNYLSQIYDLEYLNKKIVDIQQNENDYLKNNELYGFEDTLQNGKQNIFKIFNMNYIGNLFSFKSNVYSNYTKKNMFAQKRFILPVYTPDINYKNINMSKAISEAKEKEKRSDENIIMSEAMSEAKKEEKEERSDEILKVARENMGEKNNINKIPNAFGILIYTNIIKQKEIEDEGTTKAKTIGDEQKEKIVEEKQKAKTVENEKIKTKIKTIEEKQKAKTKIKTKSKK
jgi:hypothetical protein